MMVRDRRCTLRAQACVAGSVDIDLEMTRHACADILEEMRLLDGDVFDALAAGAEEMAMRALSRGVDGALAAAVCV